MKEQPEENTFETEDFSTGAEKPKTAKTFGPTLVAARTAARKSVEEISETTRIQTSYLRALETEDWNNVPGGVIGRGFVRLLSRELSLDAEALMSLYIESRSDGNSYPVHVVPKPNSDIKLKNSESFLPKYIILGIVLLLILGWFGYLGVRKLVFTGKTTGQRENIESSQSEREAAKAAAAGVGTVEENTSSNSVFSENKKDAAETSAQQMPVAEGIHDLKIQAVESVWVSVVIDGRDKNEQMMGPGEVLSFEAKNNFAVRLGSAGSVRLFWNGELLKIPGKLGQLLDLSLPMDLNDLEL